MKKSMRLGTKKDPQAEAEMDKLLGALNLTTVCKNAACPNIGECITHHTATFMILGTNCTRACSFCTVKKGVEGLPDPAEPENVARAAKALALQHTALTSAARDDLPDGGAAHFAKTIFALKAALPTSTVEAIIPDFMGNEAALKTLLDAHPDILCHSVETVPALYGRVRPMADYSRSVRLLGTARAMAPDVCLKSGLMVGLGESEDDVLAVMEDLKAAGCDILTIGQYLPPSPAHISVIEYVSQAQFDAYKAAGQVMGFRYVACGPFIRPFHHSADCLSHRKSVNAKV